MVRIRVKDGFWGTFVIALLAGCAVVGWSEYHPTAWWVCVLAGCLVGMLTFGLIRDAVRAWLRTEK